MAHIEADFTWDGAQIMYCDYGVVAPVITDGEYLGSFGTQLSEVAPTKFRHLLSHANNSLHPVQQRVRVPALLGYIHMLKAIRSRVNDGESWLFSLRESCMRFSGPLHRGTRA